MFKRVMEMTLLLGLVAGGVTWLHAQQSPNELLTTQDYIDIQQLYARYNWVIDAGDADAYAALFTPDGSFNTYSGHDALVGFIKNRKGETMRHWNSGLVITGTPEGATGKVYLLLVDVGAKPPVISAAAQYEDVMVKTPQGWRFKKRQTHRDPPAPPAAPPPTPQ